MKTMKKTAQVAISSAIALTCGLSTIGLVPFNVLAASGSVDIDEFYFPDDSFRSFVSKNYDKNKDGVLSKSESDAVTEMTLKGDGKNFEDLSGLQYFDELETLTLDSLAIDSSYYIYDCSSLKNLTIKNCENIESMVTSLKTLETVDISGNTSIESLMIIKTNLKTLNVSGCTSLEKASIQNNQLTSLDISGCDALFVLNADGNKLTSIDVTKAPKLSIKFVELPSKTVLIPPTAGLIDNEIISYSEGLAEGFSEDNTALTFDPAVKIINGSDTFVYGKGITSSNPTPSKPSTSTTPSSEDSGVAGFVERLYTVAMNRESDASGKEYWTNEVKMNGKTGADLALSFLLSEEFLNKNMTNDQFLEVLYKTFFDRAGEAAGKKYWTDELTSGRKSKVDVIYGFINSEEWANICLSYGIKSGTEVKPTISVTANSQIKGFAERLYTKCLGRASEADGLNFWADELANLRKSGSEVAYGFFFSQEMKTINPTDKEFIAKLYTTMMGREYDEGGMNYWLGQMKNGATRENVFDGFAGSEEWAGICADYGILK